MFKWINDHQNLVKIVVVILMVIVLGVLIYIAKKYEKQDTSNKAKIKKMTMIATLAALSSILYYFIKFPIQPLLSFMPGFLDIHFSNVPIYIGGYLLGPTSGMMIAIIRFLVKIPATTTATVGELSDLIIATATVLVTSIVYHKHKSKDTAVKLSVLTVAIWMLTAFLSNWLIIMPFYIGVYGFDVVFNMMSMVPGITETNFMFYYLMIVVVPFNFIISSIVSFFTFITYKRVSKLFELILNEQD